MRGKNQWKMIKRSTCHDQLSHNENAGAEEDCSKNYLKHLWTECQKARWPKFAQIAVGDGGAEEAGEPADDAVDVQQDDGGLRRELEHIDVVEVEDVCGKKFAY
jgi:hypothetical protein